MKGFEVGKWITSSSGITPNFASDWENLVTSFAYDLNGVWQKQCPDSGCAAVGSGRL
jgi:hypothetical protein